MKRELAQPVLKNRKVPSTIRDPRTAWSRAPCRCCRPPRARPRRSTVSPQHWEGLGIRDEVKGALRRPSGAREPCCARHEKQRPVSKNRKVGTVDRDPRTARRYALNERRRPRDARLQRETESSRVGARLSAAARAGNAACASRRRLEGGWSREENASGAITPSTDGSGRSVAENGVREKRDRAVLRAE